MPVLPGPPNLAGMESGRDEQLLAYLGRLSGALLARDAAEIRRLLRHPLANTLPRGVRSEAMAIARAGAKTLRAPIHALRFYHQTVQLLRGSDSRRQPAPAEREAAGNDLDQLDLPLAANDE